MATPVYPDDATISQESFSVVSSNTWTSTGSATTFTLTATASSRGEVLAIADGITQATSSYTLGSGGTSITFTTAPSASNLTLKVINVPERFLINRTVNDALAVNYSNTAAVVINSNSFIINANTESFALATGANITSTDELFVYLSGVYQDSTAYTFPSVVYGTDGIDIGDNTATKLLLNFDSNANVTTTTDASDSAHTMTFIANAKTDNTVKQFGESSLLLDGTGDYVTTPASTDFDLLSDNFTMECFVRPATGFTSNLTILGRTASVSDFYRLDVLANSNISFTYMQDGYAHEVIGGNANGGIFYHVAACLDHADSELALYVNNVRVQTKIASNLEANSMVLTGAPLEIGNANVIVQNFNGHIDALRLSKSLKYDTAGCQAMNTAPTVLGGGALGSVQSTDKLSIRSFDMTVSYDDRFTSMIDRKPDAGFATGEKFEVATFTSQAGYEKRRLKSRRSKRNYALTYTNVTGVEKVAIEEFYRARSGTFESFIFDLSHINDQGRVFTKFAGDLSITQVLSTGITLSDNFYTVNFGLQEVFD